MSTTEENIHSLPFVRAFRGGTTLIRQVRKKGPSNGNLYLAEAKITRVMARASPFGLEDGLASHNIITIVVVFFTNLRGHHGNQQLSSLEIHRNDTPRELDSAG